MLVPTLNAAATLGRTLASLGPGLDVLVIDGGSTDTTRQVAHAAGARVLGAPRGRGSQLAAGVAATSGPWLLLLHADTRLAPGWRAAAARHMAEGPGRAGYFRLAFDSPAPAARRTERLAAWRARRLGLPYGDQGLLIARSLLAGVGGLRPLPLMEDVDLARRLGRRRLAALDAVALTSAARFEAQGWARRSAGNIALVALYRLGLPPRLLAWLYG